MIRSKQSMPVTQQQKNQHLLWRAGFGVNAETISNIDDVSHTALYKTLQTASLAKPEYFDVADNRIKGLVMGMQQAAEMQQMQNPDDKDKRKQFRKASTQSIRSLNTTWLNEMVNRCTVA